MPNESEKSEKRVYPGPQGHPGHPQFAHRQNRQVQPHKPYDRVIKKMLPHRSPSKFHPQTPRDTTFFDKKCIAIASLMKNTLDILKNRYLFLREELVKGSWGNTNISNVFLQGSLDLSDVNLTAELSKVFPDLKFPVAYKIFCDAVSAFGKHLLNQRKYCENKFISPASQSYVNYLKSLEELLDKLKKEYAKIPIRMIPYEQPIPAASTLFESKNDVTITAQSEGPLDLSISSRVRYNN